MKFRERVSVICLYNQQILGFEAVDPHSGEKYFFLPGGAIENGETQIQAAVRETLEETGYIIEIVSQNPISKRYPFHWNGADFDCLTHFYFAKLKGDFHPPMPVQDQDYNKGACWRPVSEIENDFKYSKPIREAVLEMLY